MIATGKLVQKDVHSPKLYVGGKNFFICNEKNFFEVFSTHEIDAIIIESADKEFVYLMTRRIRQHNHPDFYLKPVFRLDFKNDLIHEISDGKISGIGHAEELIPVINKINFQAAQLNKKTDYPAEELQLKRLIDFIFTREIKKLEPVADPNSPTGYSYFSLQSIFNFDFNKEFIQLLDRAEQSSLLQAEFCEKVYLCSECHSGILNYREVCPHCNSVNTTCEDLVHHFPCAKIAPISDFRKKNPDQLECPKCNKHLKHIGVDYDKPSVFHHCNHCDKNFQDIFVKAKCLCCGKDNEVEYLLQRDIKSYTVSQKLNLAAVNGLDELNKPHVALEGSVIKREFESRIRKLIDKIKLKITPPGIIASLHFSNLNQLLNEGGDQFSEGLQKDLINVLVQHFHPEDFIYCHKSDHYIVYLNSITPEDGNGLMDIVRENITELFQSNFKGFTPELNWQFKQPSDFNQDIETLFNL